MAVMYSKLGDCQGVTTKFGTLARTDLWAGVKGLLDKLMNHLGLGSSLEGPLGKPIRNSGGGIDFPGVSTVYLGGSVVILGSLPKTLPAWPSLITCLTCLGITPSFPGGKVIHSLGRTVTFPGRKVSSCQQRITSFPSRKVSNSLGDTAAFFPGRKMSSCLGRNASFPKGKESTCLTACLK